jgi:hypothetical protein
MKRGWRIVFWVEVVICAATVLSWALAPEPFLRGVIGIEAPDLRHHLLLLLGANVVFCAYVYLYARLLLERPFPRVAFRRLQEAMALGDVVMLATSAVQCAQLSPDPALMAAQIGMAALWLGIRVTWLVQSRHDGDAAPTPAA